MRFISLTLFMIWLAGGLGVGLAEKAFGDVSPPPEQPIFLIEAGAHTSDIPRIGTDRGCTLIATASTDKTIRLWSNVPNSSGSFDLIRTLRAAITSDMGQFYAIAVSPDGRFVVGGGATGIKSEGAWWLYVFDAITGRIVKTLPLSERVVALAFSGDGQFLAATLKSGQGLRVWRTSDWQQVAKDEDYGGKSSYGVAFGHDGHLFTVGDDGFLRRYGADFSLDKKIATADGKEPFSVAANPADNRIAVGYYDSPFVTVYQDDHDLGVAYKVSSPTAGADGSLRSATWSGDGSRLLAAGHYNVGGRPPVRLWEDGGRGPVRELDMSGGYEPMQLLPCADDIVVSTENAAFGLFTLEGKRLAWQERSAVDMHEKDAHNFTVSEDGSRVRFGLEVGAGKPVIFDLRNERLDEAPDNPADLFPADTQGLAGWNKEKNPSFDGKPLKLEPFERALSAARLPDGQRFAVGADYYMRQYDLGGNELHRLDVRIRSPLALNASRDGKYLVGATEDGTIRWYRASDLKEVLALFVQPHDRRWILWTPKGYYLASVGGESLAGWQLNRGWDKAADFVPVERFRDDYYRPDIVRLTFDLGDEDKAIAAANEKAKLHKTEIDIRRNQPPVLDILKPQYGEAFSTTDVTFDYEARSPTGKPITEIGVLIDGEAPRTKGLVPMPGEDTWKSDDRRTGRLQLKLPERDVKVTLVARSADGSSEPRTVLLKWSGVATPAKPSKPYLKALVVGINEYRYQSLKLKWAVKDARDFADALNAQKERAYSQVEVQPLFDADRDAILRGLGWLRKPIEGDEAGDVVRVLFLSGHSGESNGRFFFVPHNANIDDLDATGVSDSDITGWLKNLPGKKVLFIDSCRSANGLDLGGLASADLSKFTNDATQDENSTVVYASSTARQLSLESDEWQHGAFTKLILAGLAGDADRYHSGFVKTGPLGTYLEEKVSDLTRGRQTPVWYSSRLLPSFVLASDPSP